MFCWSLGGIGPLVLAIFEKVFGEIFLTTKELNSSSNIKIPFGGKDYFVEMSFTLPSIILYLT